MGEIVIKIPGRTTKVLDLTKEDFSKELEEVDLLLKELKQKKALRLLDKLAGILSEDFEVSEEELHLQGD